MIDQSENDEYYDSSSIMCTEGRLKCLKGCALSKEPCPHLANWARYNRLPSKYTDRFRPINLRGSSNLPTYTEKVTQAEENTLPESISDYSEKSSLNAEKNMFDFESKQLPEPVPEPDVSYQPVEQSDGITQNYDNFQTAVDDMVDDYQLASNNMDYYNCQTPTPMSASSFTELKTAQINYVTQTPTQLRPIPSTPVSSIRRTGGRNKNIQSDEAAAIRAKGHELMDTAPIWKIKKAIKLLEHEPHKFE